MCSRCSYSPRSEELYQSERPSDGVVESARSEVEDVRGGSGGSEESREREEGGSGLHPGREEKREREGADEDVGQGRREKGEGREPSPSPATTRLSRLGQFTHLSSYSWFRCSSEGIIIGHIFIKPILHLPTAFRTVPLQSLSSLSFPRRGSRSALLTATYVLLSE